MAKTINQTSALTALSREMGKRVLPQGENLDWKDYVQFAYDYSWRYYRWDFSLKVATIDLAADPYLPADFDLSGYREPISGTDTIIKEVTLVDFYRLPQSASHFALQYDATLKRYKVVSSMTGTLDIIYQTEPPTLTDDTEVPFPSVVPIGVGAAVYAKQGENPTRADISQEWDLFHAELDRHVARADGNQPRNTNLNLHDYYGTYPGDTRV